MKSIYVIGFVLFCATAAAQTTEIHVDTCYSGDSTTCISWAETANCEARFAMAVTVKGYEITIIETDTIAEKAFCNCEYGLSARVRGLQTGSYTVTVLRNELQQFGYPEDTQYVVGTATFNIMKSYPLAFSTKVSQSTCGGMYVLRPHRGEMWLSTHPNPSSGDVTVEISFGSERPTLISIMIFDALGRRIAPGFTQERFDRDGLRLHLPASLFTHGGLYFCSVTTDSETRTQPFMIVK